MNSVAWRDALFGALIGITFLFIAVLASIVKKAQDAEHGAPRLGSLVITMIWPADNFDDVDLWVTGPGEPHPVGYSAKNGDHIDLLRDDIPSPNDGDPIHIEDVVSRSLPPGRYVINAHCYACPQLPVTVTFLVDENRPGDKSTLHLFKRVITLTADGEEQTAIRFDLDDHGNIVSGSVDHLETPLRSAK